LPTAVGNTKSNDFLGELRASDILVLLYLSLISSLQDGKILSIVQKRGNHGKKIYPRKNMIVFA